MDFTDLDPLPLVTFGPRSPYYSYLTAAVEASGRSHRIALQWPSLRGVQDAIEAGLGVGMLNASNLTDGMRVWRGIDPVELPRVVFVLRTRQDSDGNELIGMLEAHLTEILMSSGS